MNQLHQFTLHACTLIDRPTAPALAIAVQFVAFADPAGVPHRIFRHLGIASVSLADRLDCAVPLLLDIPPSAGPLTAAMVFDAIRANYLSNGLLRNCLDQWATAA